MNGRGTIRRRDTGGDPFASVDGDRERGAEGGRVLRRLRRQLQLLHPLRSQRQTDEATRMFGHEVDGVRRDLAGRHHKIALVFTIFVIDEDDELPLLDILDRVFDRIKRCRHNPSMVQASLLRWPS